MNTSLTAALTRLTYVTAVVLILLGIWAISRIYTEYYPQASEPATITVTGTGDAVGTPDVATMSFSVIEQGDTVEEVTSTTNDAMANIVATLKGAGIAAADIQTTSYALNPRYDYSEAKAGAIVGYSLTQGVTVKVRDLDAVGEVVDAATAAGANDVSSPQFEIDDPEAVKTEARAEAFEQAKDKAASLAEAAGVKLGDIVTFSEEDSGVVAPQPYYERSVTFDAVDGAGATIETGSQEVNVSVSVTYALR